VTRPVHGPARRWMAALQAPGDDGPQEHEVVEVRPGDDPDEVLRGVLPALARRLARRVGSGVVAAAVAWAPLDASVFRLRRSSDDLVEIRDWSGEVRGECVRSGDGWRFDADDCLRRDTLHEAVLDGVGRILYLAERAGSAS
jgi:hypothetical protein